MMMMAVALLGAGFSVHAQTSAKDSLKVINLQEVQVVSTRATAKTPVAFTNIGKAELKKVNFGQDIPYLLSMTPSTLTTSDAGSGIGYTTLRETALRRLPLPADRALHPYLSRPCQGLGYRQHLEVVLRGGPHNHLRALPCRHKTPAAIPPFRNPQMLFLLKNRRKTPVVPGCKAIEGSCG